MHLCILYHPYYYSYYILIKTNLSNFIFDGVLPQHLLIDCLGGVRNGECGQSWGQHLQLQTLQDPSCSRWWPRFQCCFHLLHCNSFDLGTFCWDGCYLVLWLWVLLISTASWLFGLTLTCATHYMSGPNSGTTTLTWQSQNRARLPLRMHLPHMQTAKVQPMRGITISGKCQHICGTLLDLETRYLGKQ